MIEITEDIANLREQVQKAAIDIITKGLEAGTINEERAKQIAQTVLESLPEGITYEEFFNKLPKLDDLNPELAEVVVPLMEQYGEKMKAINDTKITELIKDGKIDEALILTNQAIEKEKSLS